MIIKAVIYKYPYVPSWNKWVIRNTKASYTYNIILLDFVYDINIQISKHYVADVGCAFFFRQEALNLFHPLDQAICIHCDQNDRRFLPEDGSRDRFRSAVIQCLYTGWHKRTGTFEMRSDNHVQLAALRNRDLELQTNLPSSNHGIVERSTACFRHKNVLQKQW